MTEQERLARTLYQCVWDNGLQWEETSNFVRGMYLEKAHKVLASDWMKTHDSNMLGTTETPDTDQLFTVVTSFPRERPLGLKTLFRKAS